MNRDTSRGPAAREAGPHDPEDPCGCGHVHGDHGHAHHHHSHAPLVRASPKVGRNAPCPCGSGKKHKKCCLAA